MDQIAINSQVYSISTESELSVILSRFNSDFVFDIIKKTLESKFNNCVCNIPSANVVESLEQNFKNLKEMYPYDKENIETVRVQTYQEIINMLCREYSLQFQDTGDLDYYSIAYYMYDFLGCNFANYITTFFANYISKEKNYLYDYLNMDSFKKNKDVTTLYNRKQFKDSKLAILNANLEHVIRNMGQFDLDLQGILSYIYANKIIVNGVMSCVASLGDFYKIYYWGIFNDQYISPVLITNIKLEIQRIQMSY